MGIASLLKLNYVAENFLDKGANVNAQGGEYGNALQVASYRGRDQIEPILLEKGANVNALQAASCKGHDQVVQMLLDKGADINAQGGRYSSVIPWS